MSRDETIELLDNLVGMVEDNQNHDYDEALKMANEALEQPKQKKGKWIIRDNPGTGWYRVTCSECGEDVTSTIPMIGFFPNAKPLWDYCPYCGAKMEV